MSSQTDMPRYEHQSRLARLLHRVLSEMEGALDGALAPYDVTAAQYVVLSALWSGRAGTAAQICKEISYSPGAMKRMLDRLEEKRLIRRMPKDDAGRAIKLEMTATGKKIFPELLSLSAQVIGRYFHALSPMDMDQLEGVLGRMLGPA